MCWKAIWVLPKNKLTSVRRQESGNFFRGFESDIDDGVVLIINIKLDTDKNSNTLSSFRLFVHFRDVNDADIDKDLLRRLVKNFKSTMMLKVKVKIC